MAKAKESIKRRIVAAIADPHAGHKLGLMNPNVELFEEAEDGTLTPYFPTLTATQTYLWNCYTEDIEKTLSLAGDCEIILIVLGDVTHGNKHKQHLVSNRMADQIIIGAANLRPFVANKNVKKIRIAKGTGAHVFDEGSAEILVANQLKAEFPNKDIAVTYHGEADIGTVLVDYSHHGPFPGSREWLRGNVARYYLQDLMIRSIMAGKNPPRLILRAHYHTLVTERVTIRANGEKYVSDLALMPSYCGMGEYARRATRSMNKITNGLLAWEIENGNLSDPHEFVRSIDIRTKEIL